MQKIECKNCEYSLNNRKCDFFNTFIYSKSYCMKYPEGGRHQVINEIQSKIMEGENHEN